MSLGSEGLTRLLIHCSRRGGRFGGCGQEKQAEKAGGGHYLSHSSTASMAAVHKISKELNDIVRKIVQYKYLL